MKQPWFYEGMFRVAALVFLFVCLWALYDLHKKHREKNLSTDFYDLLLVLTSMLIMINVMGLGDIFYVFQKIDPIRWKNIAQITNGGIFTTLCFYLVYVCVMGFRHIEHANRPKIRISKKKILTKT